MTQRARVLLGSDDPPRSGRWAGALASQGLVPSLAFGGRQLVEFLDADDFDLVIVDVEPGAGGNPRITGGAAVSMFDAIAQRTDAPVVALGATGSVALELVAHGVLVLPPDGDAAETAQVLRSLVGERRGMAVARIVRHGPLELDVGHRSARWHDAPLDLTRLQFRLLVALATAEGALVSRADLHRALYGSAPIDDGERVVAHVRRVREKVETDSSHPAFILTVRGEGFRLADRF